jgi:hypothetical protein
MRKMQFRVHMKKLLIRFNELTENFKVEFRECYHGDSFASTTYYLDLIQLRPVPGSVRDAPPLVQDTPCCVAEFPVPVPRDEVSENSNSGVVVACEIVGEIIGQPQKESRLSASSFQEMRTNATDDLPVAIAATADLVSSQYIGSPHHTAYGVPELEILRRDLDELQLENACLRTSTASSAGVSETSMLVSPEVLELRREIEGMRQMMRQMSELSKSQSTEATKG